MSISSGSRWAPARRYLGRYGSGRVREAVLLGVAPLVAGAGCRDDDVDAGSKRDRRRVEHEVVQRGVARIDPIEVLDVGLAGAIGLGDVALRGRPVDALDLHSLPDPGVDRPVEPDVQCPRILAEDDRGG